MRLMKERNYYFQNNPEELEELKKNTLKMKNNFRTKVDLKKESKLIENYLTLVDLNNRLKSDDYDSLAQFKENFEFGENSKNLYDKGIKNQGEYENSKDILKNSNRENVYGGENRDKKSILKQSGFNQANNNYQNYENRNNFEKENNYENDYNYENENNYQNKQNYENENNFKNRNSYQNGQNHNNSNNFKNSYSKNNTINKYTNDQKKNFNNNPLIPNSLNYNDEFLGLNEIQKMTQMRIKKEKQEKKKYIKNTYIFFGIKKEDPYKNLDQKRKINFKNYNKNQNCPDLYYLNPITLKKEIFKTNEKIREKLILPDWHDYQRNDLFKINQYLFFGIKPSKKFFRKKQIADIKEIDCINQLYGSNLYLNTYNFPL